MRSRNNVLTTVSEIDGLYEDGNRYEVIEGELYVSTAPSFWHQNSLMELAFELRKFLRENPIGTVMPGIGLIFDELNGVVPDLVYYSNERGETIAGGLHLTGAPEIVIEILSPGSKNETRDKKTKRTLYSENGVSEYWVLDPQSRSIEIHRASRTGGFKSKAILREGDLLKSSLLPGFQCEVRALFSPRKPEK